ncbi:unnamed protein product [Effrenium voratum]|nr:unnamed protein product [Effrenium voratum]|mmetsp:Transcript_134704/g.319294  ORF Transcript_134704/g.319294 Transcript_134704/m.319294 type:complete len:115 (-) Transcript_134704:259-603(-)
MESQLSSQIHGPSKETMEMTSWFSQTSAAEMRRLHQLNKCYPCVAFALRAEGCFKGENCLHCHHCTADNAIMRRKQLQAQARRKRRQAGRGQESESSHSAGSDTTQVKSLTFWL